MVSKFKEKKKPNYFRFIRESILGNLSVTVFHSGHLSHFLKLSDQPYRRQKTLTDDDFSGDLFPTPTIPSGAQGGDLQVFSKHRRENLSQAPTTRVSSPAAWISRASAWGRVEHFPATRFHLQPRLTPSSHPLSVLVSSEPWKCIFLGFFVSADPLNNLSSDFRWLPLHPKPCTCLRKCSSTLPVVLHLFFFTIWSLTAADPWFFFFQPRSEAVLGSLRSKHISFTR